MLIAIADDESLARLRLKQLCEDIQSEFETTIVAEFPNAMSLIKALPQLNADVLLLDVNMPGIDGIEMAYYLQKNAPYLAIIFVTAEPHHALEAFNVQAIDYVLKPVSAERLLKALRKAEIVVQNNHIKKEVNTIKIDVIKDNKIHSIAVNNIVYIKADEKISLFMTAHGVFHSYQSLSELHKWLDMQGYIFLRIHRNTLISGNAINEIVEHDGSWYVKINEQYELLNISRRMLTEVREYVFNKNI